MSTLQLPIRSRGTQSRLESLPSELRLRIYHELISTTLTRPITLNHPPRVCQVLDENERLRSHHANPPVSLSGQTSFDFTNGLFTYTTPCDIFCSQPSAPRGLISLHNSNSHPSLDHSHDRNKHNRAFALLQTCRLLRREFRFEVFKHVWFQLSLGNSPQRQGLLREMRSTLIPKVLHHELIRRLCIRIDVTGFGPEKEARLAGIIKMFKSLTEVSVYLDNDMGLLYRVNKDPIQHLRRALGLRRSTTLKIIHHQSTKISPRMNQDTRIS
ncbi:hypothetical protein B0T22DRAFT_147684 [Podospora appendiculata]|uniref:Uncharacterized protein n=1 Tax=Podospora appendiculata TaxID=314037 RepID=A0AAE1CC26_9PEZI|nr:hypothetical protein B0T22DRAFT_147684 [Podospora appendiculata]